MSDNDKNFFNQGDMPPVVESKNRYIAPEPSKKKKKAALIVGITVAAMLVTLLAVGLIGRMNQKPDMPKESVGNETYKEIQEPASKHEHTEFVLNDIEPTCSETGMTEGIQCKECGDVLVEQNPIPTIEHTYGEWIIDNDADFHTAGSRHRSCMLCGYNEIESIKAFSKGLQYTLTDDGTYCVSGLGICRDTDIVIPAWYNEKSVTGISEEAFRDCTSLTSVTIGENITHIGYLAFAGCLGITSITVSEKNPVYHIDGNCLIETASKTFLFGFNDFAIPDDGSVISIGNGAFFGCTYMTSISIPNSVVSIGDNAFYGCKNLVSIMIPQSVVNIGEYAFYDCDGLTSIELPNSVTSISSGLFEGCDGILSIDIPSSVTSIGDRSFYGCRGLLSINIPNSVTSIGNYAFADSHSLLSIVLPDQITSISANMFENCEGLMSVSIPNSVTSINAFAFSNCTSLTSIDIPDSVTYIGWYTFRNSGLTEIVIPDSVTNINDSAFSHCTKLTHATIGNGVTKIGSSTFFYCNNLTDITIGSGILKICNHAFIYCRLISINYIGTESEWNAIIKEERWNEAAGPYTLHFNYTPS